MKDCLECRKRLILHTFVGQVDLRQNVLIEVHDARTGRLLESELAKNSIILAGRNLVRDVLRGSDPAPTHSAVGTNSTAVADSQTALLAEVHRNVITQRIADTSKLTWKFFLPSTAANGNTLREAGIFNAATAGAMLSRVTFAEIIKTTSISVTFTWVHTITSS